MASRVRVNDAVEHLDIRRLRAQNLTTCVPAWW
jgi:hypothetical protein